MKICFVVQRSGLEVNGGAEVLARQLAEQTALLTDHTVEIATTKAIDYVTWKNEYEKDEEELNGVLIHRFPVVNERDQDKFNKFTAKMLEAGDNVEIQEEWMRLQGPETPALIEWLSANKENYDCFIFMTYLYYTTYYGLKAVGDKAIFIPTAHEEWPIHLKMFEEMFRLPKFYYYNTIEEKILVNDLFPWTKDYPDNNGTGGAGVEVPENVSAEGFRSKFGIEGDFMIYVGRIDENKCCPELFKYFREFKDRNKDSDLKLVLVGKEIIDVPKSDDIISLGFVSEEDKYNAIAASRFLVLPSHFESLSIVVLESMFLSHPVLVSGKCDVLRGHCRRSNAGLYYRDFYEFEGSVRFLLREKEISQQMGRNGRDYVDENYSWKNIVARLDRILKDHFSGDGKE